MDWVVRQYRGDVHAGDRVYIWRSGPAAGVIAIAEVLSDPAPMAAPDDPFAVAGSPLDKIEPRVMLRIDEVLHEPLKRSDLVEHPVLKKLGVIAFANATNFAVSTDEDAALRALIAGDGTADIGLRAVGADVAAKVFLPQAWLQDVVELLEEKRQLIFYGPPGTGKTFVAQALARTSPATAATFATRPVPPVVQLRGLLRGLPAGRDRRRRRAWVSAARTARCAGSRRRRGRRSVPSVRPDRRRDQPRQRRRRSSASCSSCSSTATRRSRSSTRRTSRSRCRGTSS